MSHQRVPPDRLDATFTALADPTRRGILARLASEEASARSSAERGIGALSGRAGGAGSG